MVIARSVAFATAMALAALTSTVASAQDEQGTWETSCISPSRSAVPQCAMRHTVRIEENGQVLFNVTVTAAASEVEGPMLDITGPLGFHLPAGLVLTVDTVDLVSLALDRCDANGCHANMRLDEAQLGRLLQGQELEITFAPAKGQTAQVKLPLTGFASSYDAIRPVAQ